MYPIRVVDFLPPVVGIEAHFNTFRLGSFFYKNLVLGETVYILDSKQKLIIGAAKVAGLHFGTLDEMLAKHASGNHTQLGLSHDKVVDNLFKVIKSIYGPHIATLTKKTTVIELRRINEQQSSNHRR